FGGDESFDGHVREGSGWRRRGVNGKADRGGSEGRQRKTEAGGGGGCSFQAPWSFSGFLWLSSGPLRSASSQRVGTRGEREGDRRGAEGKQGKTKAGRRDGSRSDRLQAPWPSSGFLRL